MITVGILTISDSIAKGIKPDKSGNCIKQLCNKLDGKVLSSEVVPDDKMLIKRKLCRMTDKLKLNLILTTGGTGFSQRDVTPEATRAVLEKEAPAIEQAMILSSFKKSSTSILSRGVAGIRKKSLIINLPGNPRAVKECLTIILPTLPHAIDILLGKATQH